MHTSTLPIDSVLVSSNSLLDFAGGRRRMRQIERRSSGKLMMLTAANTAIAAIADVLSPWPDLPSCCTLQKRCWPDTLLMRACLALTMHCRCSQCIQEPSPNPLSREVAHNGHGSVLEVLKHWLATYHIQGGWALTAAGLYFVYWTLRLFCTAPGRVSFSNRFECGCGRSRHIFWWRPAAQVGSVGDIWRQWTLEIISLSIAKNRA